MTGEPDELRHASIDVDGHALALILLGTYLEARCGGDVAKRSEALLFHGHERNAAHAHKVMASYEAWFSQQDDTGRAAVAILRLMGLFNRPADAGCLAALRAEPPIPGLTEALTVGGNDQMRDELWQRAIERLRAARLLADDPPALDSGPAALDSLDAHPLVREHFAGQLATDHKASSVEAHRRLYEHLKQSAPELPDNLNDMMPLYHAVAHGCKAFEAQNVFNDVYRTRICREREFYSMKKLGAHGATLSALASFFETPWSVVSDQLAQGTEFDIVGHTAFCLRALGRLRDAVQPMRLALSGRIVLEFWNFAAIAATNLSELSLMLGDVSSAVRQGEQSVELADRSGDAFLRMGLRTTLAAALYAVGGKTGRRGKKEVGSEEGLLVSLSPDLPLSAFREAEAMQQERQPQYPLLYSLGGYGYCDLLLDLSRPDQAQRRFGRMDRDAEDAGTALRSVRPVEPADESPEQAIARIREVRNRAEKMFEWRSEGDSLLDIALDHLTLGRTYLAEAELQTEPTVRAAGVDGESDQTAKPEATAFGSLQQAEHHLNQSVSLLRQAGNQDQLPRGLLHRAALWRVMLSFNAQPEAPADRGAETDSHAVASGSALNEHPSPDLSPQGERDFYALADRDLSEAESIAERGSMLIWRIEAALERTRLFLTLHHAGWESEESAALWLPMAREKLEETRRLVAETESEYQPHVADWDEWKPPDYVNVFKKGTRVGYHCRDGEIDALDAEIDQAWPDDASQGSD